MQTVRAQRASADPGSLLTPRYAKEALSAGDFKFGAQCPGCGEPWLRPTAVPGNYRCLNCLRRFELVSVCPNCGEHSTIVRMSSTAIVMCNHCKGSMLRSV
jgi:predicted nucleic acid-binding Zn ribbon protein